MKNIYKKGTKICYPFHGVGKIEEISTKEFNSEKQEYYSISFSDENLKVLVPIDKAEDLGLRKALSKNEVEALLKVLKERASEPNIKDADRSYFLHMIGSLDTADVAKGVCDLLCKKEMVGLKRNEGDLLKRGINILDGLIVYGKKVKSTEARKMIMDCWKKGLDTKTKKKS